MFQSYYQRRVVWYWCCVGRTTTSARRDSSRRRSRGRVAAHRCTPPSTWSTTSSSATRSTRSRDPKSSSTGDTLAFRTYNSRTCQLYMQTSLGTKQKGPLRKMVYLWRESLYRGSHHRFYCTVKYLYLKPDYNVNITFSWINFEFYVGLQLCTTMNCIVGHGN